MTPSDATVWFTIGMSWLVTAILLWPDAFAPIARVRVLQPVVRINEWLAAQLTRLFRLIAGTIERFTGALSARILTPKD